MLNEIQCGKRGMPCVDPCNSQMRAFIHCCVIKIFLLAQRLFKRFDKDNNAVAGKKRVMRLYFSSFGLRPLHVDTAALEDFPNRIFCKIDAVP